MSRSSYRSNIPPMPGRGDAVAGPPGGPPRRAIIERFLFEARRAGAIDDATQERLLRFMDTASVPAPVRAPPSPVTPAPAPQVARVPAPHRPTPQRAVPPRPAPSAPVVRPPVPKLAKPSPTTAWLARARAALVSDLTVHGLAYLGVFLVLTGTLGFFIFSFGSMSESIRPWAELAIPTVLFGSALFLRGRGAPVVATALGLIGGLLLPVVLFASYVDSVGVPPDFSDVALGWAVIVTSLVLAGVYAAIAAWWPELSTRFLVAPMVWVALFGIGMLLSPPNRATFQSWTAAQGALVAIGVAGTAVVCALRPRAALARDASLSVLPGAVVAILLTLVLPGVSATNWWPYAVTGLATILTAEAVAGRLDRPVVQVVQALAMSLSVYGLWLGEGDQVAGVVGVLAAIGLLELQEYRAPGPAPLLIGAVLAGGALLLAARGGEPLPLAWSLTAVAGWAHARRIHPLPAVRGALFEQTMAMLAVTTSSVAAILWIDARGTGAYLTEALLVLVLSGLVRGLRPSDRVLAWWLFWSAGALGIAAAASIVIEPWSAAATLALVAGALFVAVVPARVRAWLVPPAIAGAMWFALVALDVAVAPRLMAVTAVAVLVTAVLTWRDGTPAHVAAASWTIATVAVAVSEPGWWLFAALAVWVGAAASVTVAGERRGVGVGGLFGSLAFSQGVDAAGPAVAPVLLLGGIAGTLLAGLDASGSIERDLPAAAVAFGVLGLVEAAGTRAFPRRTPLREVVAVAAYGAVLVAMSASAQNAGPSALAMGLAIASVVAITPAVRWTPVVWVAWAVSFGFVARAGEALGVATRDLPLILGAWATLLAVGGLILDDARAGRRPVGMLQVRDARLRAPVLFGVLVLPVASVASLSGSDVRIAVVSCAAAFAIAAVAVALRLGVLTLGSYLLVTVGAVAITPRDPMEEPWVAVAWAAALLLVAAVLRLVSKDVPPVARWDLPPALVAAGAVSFAIVLAPLVDEIVVTYLAAGALILVTGLVLRSVPGVGLGAALLVIAAVNADPGWGALALAIAAVGVAVPAALVRLEPSPRVAAQTVATALFVGALVEARDALGASWFDLAIVCAVVATASIVAFTVVWRRLPDNPVAQQLGLLGVGVQTLAFAAAVAALPDHGALAAVLCSAAVGVGVPAAGLRLEAGPRVLAQVVAVALFAGAIAQLREVTGTAWSDLAIACAVVGMSSILGATALWRARPWSVLATQLAALGVGLQGLAAVAAGNALPSHDALAVTLFAAAVSVGAPAAALRLELATRSWAQAVAAALFVAAVAQAREVLETPWSDLAIACAAVGALSVVAATVSWRRRPENALATQLATLGVGLVGLGGMAADQALPSQEPMAAVLLAGAVAVAVPAAALRLDPILRTWFQAFAAALFVGAGFEAGEAAAATWPEMVTVSLTVAVLGAVVFALLWLRRPGGAVAAQLGLVGLAAESFAVIAAWQAWPDHEPMAAAVLVAAIQAVAASVALHDVRVTMVSPPLVCVAWLLLAGDLLAGSVMWWAAPVGLATLVVGSIARADRRRRDLPVATPELVALEYAGMAAILLPPLVETATISPVRGLIGIGFGLAIVGWALVSRVRRRLFAGAGGIVAIVLVMILGQVADLIPRIEGPTLWAVIVAAGFVLIVIATGIERGRTRAAEAIAKLNELLDGWE